MRDICFCLGKSEAVVSFKFWRELQEIQCIYQFSISTNVIVRYPFLCIHFVTKIINFRASATLHIYNLASMLNNILQLYNSLTLIHPHKRLF